MTLEDQIRRMGAARAAEVSTPSWRDRLGRDGGLPWRWVGAAAAILVLAVGVFAVLSDDDNDDDTFAGDPSEDDAPIRRWVPEGEISLVQYGHPEEASFPANAQIALVTTPDDAGRVDDDDWTQVRPGASYLVFQSDEPQRLSNDNGVAIVWIPEDDRTNGLMLVSRRFTEDELFQAAESLVGATIATAAEEISGWADDIEVVYEGSPAVPDVIVNVVDTPHVLWLTTDSDLQYAASYPPLPDGSGFVFGPRGNEFATQDRYRWTEGAPPPEIADDEWRDLHDELAARIDVVELDAHMFTLDRDNSNARADDLRIATASVVSRDASFTIELEFEQPVAFESSDWVSIRMLPLLLVLRSVGPPETTDSLVLDARMSEWEAERIAGLINDRLTAPEPDPDRVPPAQTGACATNPVPGDDVLDVATHIAFDRTPLDLDQDGIDDEMLIYDDADGSLQLIARLQTGWTNAVDLGQPEIPALAQTSDGVPAATDLDGDGQLEFFITGYLGEGWAQARLVSFRGCELVVSFATDGGAESTVDVNFDLLAELAAICRARGCATRVSCPAGVLTQELFLGPALNDVSGQWLTEETRLAADGTFAVTELPPVDVGFTPLVDPPTEDTTGVIDCVP